MRAVLGLAGVCALMLTPVAKSTVNWVSVLDYGADPTGVADSTTAIQAAIDATTAGRTLYLPFGEYKLTAALTINKALVIRGDGALGLHGSRTANGSHALDVPLTSPYLSGTVLVQTTAATDAIKITACGLPVNLYDFGIRFDGSHRFTNTGHGINAAPTQTLGGALDSGVISGVWERITVFGHDGNHYAFRCVNQLCCTFRHLRSFGGGGLLTVNNNDQIAGFFGNMLCDHFYGQLFCNGTSHGIYLQIVSNSHGLTQFNRPQVSMNNLTTEFPTTTAPTTAQKMFYADDGINYLSLIQPDFESGITNGTIKLPAGPQLVDPSGLINGTLTTGIPGTYTSSNWPWLKFTSYANRSMTVDGRIQAHAVTAGEGVLGFYDKTTSIQGPGIYTDGSGAATGIVGKTAPRPSARKADLAFSPLDTAPAYSNGTDWSDQVAAPTITALTDISNLNIDVVVHGQGTNGNPLSTLTNSVASGNFTQSGSARPTYNTTIATAGGKATAFFDGSDDVMVSSLSAAPASFTDFYVVYFAVLPTTGQADLSLSTGTGVRVRIRSSPSGRIGLEKQNTFGFSDSAYPIVVGQFMLVVVRYDGTTATYRTNCTPMGTASGSQTFGASNVSIGGGAPFYLARFVRYQHATTTAGAITDDNIKSVEKFLRLWGTLP